MDRSIKKVRAHLLISGRVQGVAFRYYTRDIAQSLEITGWVKNCWDGKVELIIEGEEDRVNELINWCHQGPKSAIVEKVEVEWEEEKGEFNSFSIRA
ncbi:MAG TPA: acylphosphatase [Candidatus Atribacteria bacterium]|nr:acylphosphatase [Candidatus Atribacteria bacterium]